MKTTWKTRAAAMMAVVGMIPLGCTSSVVGGGGGGGGGGQPPDCPAAAPATGSACSAAASGCSYAAGPCTVEMSCDLEVGAWQSQTTSCAPMAKECLAAQEGDACTLVGESCSPESCLDGNYVATCGDDHQWHLSPASSFGEDCCSFQWSCPPTIPSAGDSCDYCAGASSCNYSSTCGQPNTAVCQPGGVWETFFFGDVFDDCPPPPPSDLCNSLGDQGACQMDATCRWLTPGCGDTPVLAPGCFTINDCGPGTCGPSEICQTFSYNPCFEKNCDACGAPASLCVWGL